MTDPVERLAALGLTLPPVAAPGGAYVPAVRAARSRHRRQREPERGQALHGIGHGLCRFM